MERWIGSIKETQVNGTKFTYYADFIKRGSFAVNAETGEEKQISYHGYLSNDLSVRKAIAYAFDLPTFRKNAVK